MASTYGAVVAAGVHRAPTIRVAEAAKVIENTQRDLNIALMNELAIIFDRMGIRTADVLAAAATKWNFLRFRPGLVGGHCIGVDPYYLTMKAQQLGYQPEVILAGRRINNNMGPYVAAKVVKLLIDADLPVKGARVAILGLTFKEDCNDIRNSKVPDILRELKQFGIEARVHDPLASAPEAQHEYGVALTSLDELAMQGPLDAVVLAVSHRFYLDLGAERLFGMVKDGGVFAGREERPARPPEPPGPSRHPVLEPLVEWVGGSRPASLRLAALRIGGSPSRLLAPGRPSTRRGPCYKARPTWLNCKCLRGNLLPARPSTGFCAVT